MTAFAICLTILYAIISTTLAGKSVPLTHADDYIGQVLGDGQCAAGIQYVFYYYYNPYWPLGLTSTWRKGQKVLGNNIPSGTAIASFNPSTGRYDCNYGCHAAIYISQDSTGIQVYDQYSGKAWGERTLVMNSSPYPAQSNQADRFYVIEW